MGAASLQLSPSIRPTPSRGLLHLSRETVSVTDGGRLVRGEDMEALEKLTVASELRLQPGAGRGGGWMTSRRAEYSARLAASEDAQTMASCCPLPYSERERTRLVVTESRRASLTIKFANFRVKGAYSLTCSR